MRGVYEAQISISGLSVAKTLILLQVPSDIVAEILGARITNADTDTNQQLRAGLYRVSTLGTPAGTSITPAKSEEDDQAAQVTATGNLTTEPSAYDSNQYFGLQGFSNLGGYFFDPVPEERVTIKPGGALGLRLIDAPDSGFHAICAIKWMERG